MLAAELAARAPGAPRGSAGRGPCSAACPAGRRRRSRSSRGHWSFTCEELVDLLLVLDHREARLRVVDDVLHLRLDRVLVERHRDPAERLGGQHGPVELRAGCRRRRRSCRRGRSRGRPGRARSHGSPPGIGPRCGPARSRTPSRGWRPCRAGAGHCPGPAWGRCPSPERGPCSCGVVLDAVHYVEPGTRAKVPARHAGTVKHSSLTPLERMSTARPGPDSTTFRWVFRDSSGR